MTLLEHINGLMIRDSIMKVYSIKDIKEFDALFELYGIKVKRYISCNTACAEFEWVRNNSSGIIEVWYGINCYLFIAAWSYDAKKPRTRSDGACIIKRPGMPIEDRWMDYLMGDNLPWTGIGVPVPYRDSETKVSIR